MRRICLGAERQFEPKDDLTGQGRTIDRTDQAIALAAMLLQEGGVAAPLLQKAGGDVPSLQAAVGQGAGRNRQTGEMIDGKATSADGAAQFEAELKAMVEGRWNHPVLFRHVHDDGRVRGRLSDGDGG